MEHIKDRSFFSRINQFVIWYQLIYAPLVHTFINQIRFDLFGDDNWLSHSFTYWLKWCFPSAAPQRRHETIVDFFIWITLMEVNMVYIYMKMYYIKRE